MNQSEAKIEQVLAVFVGSCSDGVANLDAALARSWVKADKVQSDVLEGSDVVCALTGKGAHLLVAEGDHQTVLVATENGFAKRTVLADFRHSGRGTQGVKAIADSERNGVVIRAKLVDDNDEDMLITTGGVLVRTRVAEIRGMGRATQGVTLISLDDGEKLAGLEKVAESVAEAEAEVEGDVVVPESADAAPGEGVADNNEGGEA